jgi:hypothetical protein
MTDRELMLLAIAELEKCSPTNPEQVGWGSYRHRR